MHHPGVYIQNIFAQQTDKKQLYRANKKVPISIGAVPIGKLSHHISFAHKYKNAISMVSVAKQNPIIVAMRNPIFVYDVKLSIAASYKVYQLLCDFPVLRFAWVYSISFRNGPSSATIPRKNGTGSSKVLNISIKLLS